MMTTQSEMALNLFDEYTQAIDALKGLGEKFHLFRVVLQDQRQRDFVKTILELQTEMKTTTVLNTLVRERLDLTEDEFEHLAGRLAILGVCVRPYLGRPSIGVYLG